MENIKNNNFFGSIAKGVGVSFIFTIITLSIFSCLLVYTNLSENLIQPVVIGITAISIFLGAFISNRKMRKNGILNGILIGVIYIGLIYIISSVVNNNFSISIGTIIMILLGILGGATGGIIGINI